MLFSTVRPSSLPIVESQLDERHAIRRASVLEWYDRHRAYNILWFINEEEVTHQIELNKYYYLNKRN